MLWKKKVTKKPYVCFTIRHVMEAGIPLNKLSNANICDLWKQGYYDPNISYEISAIVKDRLVNGFDDSVCTHIDPNK